MAKPPPEPTSDHIRHVKQAAHWVQDAEEQLLVERAQLAFACQRARRDGRLSVTAIAALISEARGRPFGRNQVYALIAEADRAEASRNAQP